MAQTPIVDPTDDGDEILSIPVHEYAMIMKSGRKNWSDMAFIVLTRNRYNGDWDRLMRESTLSRERLEYALEGLKILRIEL